MKDKLRNIAFQFVWYTFLRKRYSPPGLNKLATIPDVFADRMLKQIEIAEKYFGGVDGVFFGDSNAEGMAEFKDMCRFDSLVINISKGGTQLQQWVQFFTKNPKGIQIYLKIGKPAIGKLCNAGGNDIIQKAFEGLAPAIKELKKLMPDAYVVGIPPIRYKAIADQLGMRASTIKSQVLQGNQLLQKAYPTHFVDVFSIFADADGNPREDVLQDAVHYRQAKQTMLIDKYYDERI